MIVLCCLPSDLTDFVQRHLFGDDLSSPLTRSGIHNSSQTQTSFNRYTHFSYLYTIWELGCSVTLLHLFSCLSGGYFVSGKWKHSYHSASFQWDPRRGWRGRAGCCRSSPSVHQPKIYCLCDLLRANWHRLPLWARHAYINTGAFNVTFAVLLVNVSSHICTFCLFLSSSCCECER